MTIHNRRCFANHLGLYAIEPGFMSRALLAIRSGQWTPNADAQPLGSTEADADVRADDPPVTGDSRERKMTARRDPDRRLYPVTGNGIAVIHMSGPMMKGWSKYAHTDTLQTRRAIRAAVGDKEVNAILIQADTPGGMVAGTEQLAYDIRAARQSKPVHGYADDLCASAGYWALSQCETITANPTAEIGSLGTLAVVYDQSEQFKMEGVEVHVISTGLFKGAFVPGSEVKKAHIDHLRQRVEDINGHFMAAVRDGRGMSHAQLEAIADGRVFGAETTTAGAQSAKDVGLIDAVATTIDPVLNAIAAQIESAEKGRDRAGLARSLLVQDLRS